MPPSDHAIPSTPIENTAMLRVTDAIARLEAAARPVVEIENVPLLEANGRICARNIKATLDIPPFANSAMDGYAFASEDFSAANVSSAPVSQRVQAGAVPRAHTPGTAARLFTGAPLPPGCDTVLAQEEITIDGEGKICLTGPLQPGRFVRRCGEDLRLGDIVIAAGQRLRSQHVGLAAAVGMTHLPVWRRLRVAVFATGNELVEPGQPLTPGKIYNANSVSVAAFLDRLGCATTQLGIIPDNLNATIDCLNAAAAQHDIIISTGGASVGDEDHIKRALQTLGTLAFWRVAIKPGKPFAFGHIKSTAFIGLPGNPVSTLVTLWILVRSYLRRSQGETPVAQVLERRVLSAFERHNDSARAEYVRAQVHAHNRDWVATLYSNQSSGVLTSLTWAHGLVCIEPHTHISRGDFVDFLSFDCL